METSGTTNGRRERALVEGAMDSGIPTQSSGGLHLAFLAGREVEKERAQRRHFEMKEKIYTQSRKAPSAPSVIDGGGSVLAAGVAGEWKTGRMRTLCESQREGFWKHGDSSRSFYL